MIFSNNIRAILTEMWPTILLVSVVCFSMRIYYLISNKQKLYLYKELINYFFIVYILCLFYVVTFQDVSWSSSNFTPFKEILRYNIGSKMFYKNVLGNMVMFVPFGFFVSYFLKLKKIYFINVLTIITSVTIEITQLLIGRVFDVDDLLLNLVGGIAGYLIYKLIKKINDKLPNFLKKTYIYNIIMMLLVGGLIFYIVKVVMV
ncbi:MAG: VanZ family protein [Bacilli bacterium]|nr:VanZ family protein [Bacilli bacterium]